MSAIEVHPDPLLVAHNDVEAYRESVREALRQGPREEEGDMICPVCERGFDPRGIAPHMDAHRRAIGDLKPRQRRPKAKLRSVVIEPAAKPEPLKILREQIKDRIANIGQLEQCDGIEEEYGSDELVRLQAKREGLYVALQLLEAL